MGITHPHILLTPGEPAGIGPDITLAIASQSFPAALTVIADPALLKERARQLRLNVEIIERDLTAPLTIHQPGTLFVLPVFLSAPVVPGKLEAENAKYVLRTLSLATTLCRQKKAAALVTGPVHKGIMNQAGIAFSGHTEFLAQECGVSQTVMLFVIDQLKVALATTHIPLKDVPLALTQSHLRNIIHILNKDLKTYFNIANPHILVCGLNPHAGESGYLGLEEIETINPLVKELNATGYQLSEALPADTIFTHDVLKQGDAILAMYHDQALPVIKYAGFDRAVNMTLGLPFIRTSVDHGTALSLTGSGNANAGSLVAALTLAIELTTKNR